MLSRGKWTNSFQDVQVSISPENFQHATKVFQKFGSENLGSYHDLYLTTDTLLLACVVEQFRKVTLSTCGLDSVHYYTCSHLFGKAFLKVIKARVELLTDRSHLQLAERLITWGVSSVFSNRLATINNKYREGFDETNAGTYSFLVDANNLFGGIMQFPLPLSQCEIMHVELSRILKTANDSEIGFVLEVDFDYPDTLHNMHRLSSGSNEREKRSQYAVRVSDGSIGSSM